MIVDCHLDLAMNAVHWNRDLTQPLENIREREAGLQDKLDRGRGVVCFPEMRKADIRLCVATQIGHSVAQNSPLQGWNSPEIAWAQTQAQLAWYEAMEAAGELEKIRSSSQLDRFLLNSTSGGNSIGYVLTLEGADSLLTLDHLERAYNQGLRIVGPAHYGPGRYAAGTGESDGLTSIGFDLLKQMEQLGIALDVTHLTDRGFAQALDNFSGPVLASHHNCRSIVDHQRQLTDEQISLLVQRGAIIGVALDAWMLVPDWIRGQSTPREKGVSLEHAADQIEKVCQIAGNASHCVIGSDLDGGYGHEQTPIEIDSIAKLEQFDEILQRRGIEESDRENILSSNAIRFLRSMLPND